MLIVFTEAFDRSEVVFDGVQVWRVRRQEQESGHFAFDQLLGLGTFVEGALSMTTTCVSFKRGQSWVSSHQLKTAVSHDPSNKIGAAKRVPSRAASREVCGVPRSGRTPAPPSGHTCSAG